MGRIWRLLQESSAMWMGMENRIWSCISRINDWCTSTMARNSARCSPASKWTCEVGKMGETIRMSTTQKAWRNAPSGFPPYHITPDSMFTIRLASSHLPLLAKGYLSAPVPLTYTSPSDKSPACLASIATFPIIPLYAGVSPPSLTICLFLFCITGHTIPCHPDEPMKTVKSCMTNSSLFLRQSNIDALQSIHLVPTANWVRIPSEVVQTCR